MRFPHCVANFYYLPWFCSIKVSNKKSHRNAVNACGNGMCKLSFTNIFFCRKKGIPRRQRPESDKLGIFYAVGVLEKISD